MCPGDRAGVSAKNRYYLEKGLITVKIYQIFCGRCRHTRKVTQEEFIDLIGAEAWEALDERIKKGEAEGGLLIFNDGCKKCKPKMRIDGILCALKPQTLVSRVV